MPVVIEFNRTLDQELAALARGVSLECLVCGEFVLHRGSSIACLECGCVLRAEGEAAGTRLEFESQAG